MVGLDDLLREGRVVGWIIYGPWGRGKEPGAIEPSEIGLEELEAGMMGSGITEFDIIETKESKDESYT